MRNRIIAAWVRGDVRRHRFLKVAALFCLIGFSFAYPAYAEQKVKILKENAELKTLPQVGSLTIARLPLGGEFSIAERISEEWIKISLPPDKDGIVQSGYVQVPFVGFVDVPEGGEESKGKKLVQEDTLKGTNPNVPMDSDSLNWRREYAAAKSRKSLWTGVAVVGGAMLAGGIVIYLTTTKHSSNPSSGFSEVFDALGPAIQQGAGATVGGLGLLICIGGFIGESAAARNVQALEREGENKGYIKIQAGILPKYHSLGVQIAWGF